MKFGASCAAHEIIDHLKFFDYVEVWDQQMYLQGYHAKPGESIRVGHQFRPYVVVHTPAAPKERILMLMVENEPGDQPDQVRDVLHGNDFLLDVGHAFTSNRYLSTVDPKVMFDFDRWFSLRPQALHLHDCRIDIPNPWGKPDAADHQLLGHGVLPLRELLRRAEHEGVLYCTVECFMDGFGARSFSAVEKRRALDMVLSPGSRD